MKFARRCGSRWDATLVKTGTQSPVSAARRPIPIGAFRRIVLNRDYTMIDELRSLTGIHLEFLYWLGASIVIEIAAEMGPPRRLNTRNRPGS
jgi:hypothetical protein